MAKGFQKALETMEESTKTEQPKKKRGYVWVRESKTKSITTLIRPSTYEALCIVKDELGAVSFGALVNDILEDYLNRYEAEKGRELID